MSLSGSSSLGAAGGVAGVAAPAAEVGLQLCPSASAGGAVALGAVTAIPVGASGPPSASTAVSGVSGCQQRQDVSRPSRRRRHSFSDRRNVRGVGLLPLVLLLAVGRGTIGHLLVLLKMCKLKLLLPELDVRLEVLLAIFTPLGRVAALLVPVLRVGHRGHPHERSVITEVLVIDPPRLRVWWMTTGRVLSTRLTLTGMTLSRQSWPSSGTSTQWESLPEEVRADFKRLILSGSRALEFLASQGCTVLGNLVLSRRDSLLADVHSMVPAEEVARLWYSPLPETVGLFPSALLDSALTKMHAAANDALVQCTLHPPRIPWKPAAAGGSAGSSVSGSGQASSSGARPAQEQTSTSSPSGQLGKKRKNLKGKLPFSSSSGGSSCSRGKGKGAGKKST